MLKKITKILVGIFFVTLPVYADNIKIFDFTKAELESLKVRKVRGANSKTEYSVGNNENWNYLKAEANNAASGVGKEV